MPEACWFELHRLEWPEKVTFLCLQGLVNREGAKLMYDAQFWNWAGADQFWKGYYTEKKGFTFEKLESTDEVLRRFASSYSGVVIYDPQVEQTMWVACTLAGLHGWLPMSPEQAGRYPHLPVRENFVGRWTDKVAPLRWALENLQPACARGIACSVDKLWSGMSIDSIDYAVMQKGFVYSAKPARPDASEDEERIAHDVMAAVGPDCAVFGWTEPEHRYCELVSMHGNYIMCAEAPNLSFHRHVPGDVSRPRQKAHADKSRLKLEDKYYVAFMTSEGDAMKIHTVLHGQAWVCPDRGKVPINWGFQPRMLELAPAMAEYYYTTATEKDYFYCGCSGAGYTFPNWIPEPDSFFHESAAWMKRADLQVLDTWIYYHRPTYELYLREEGIDAITIPAGPGGPVWMSNGKPVIRRYRDCHYYPPGKTPEQIAETIRTTAKRDVKGRPGFIVFFFVPDWRNKTSQGGYSPTELARVEELLGDEFKVVTLEEMVWAAYQTRPT
ncbi:MAG: hypothetical protein AMXMBFR13_35300 [Phycisphaerae bacterium]